MVVVVGNDVGPLVVLELFLGKQLGLTVIAPLTEDGLYLVPKVIE